LKADVQAHAGSVSLQDAGRVIAEKHAGKGAG
jgi:hypothetical protein